MSYNPIKGPDGLYEVRNAAGNKMWVEEHILMKAITAVKAKGLDPQNCGDELMHACADEIDKGLIPGALLMSQLLMMGIGTEEMGDEEDEYDYYDDEDEEDLDDADDGIDGGDETGFEL